MNATCLLAISYARDHGEFQRARDMLRDFVPYNREDELDVEYAEFRIAQFESRAIAARALVGGASHD